MVTKKLNGKEKYQTRSKCSVLQYPTPTPEPTAPKNTVSHLFSIPPEDSYA